MNTKKMLSIGAVTLGLLFLGGCASQNPNMTNIQTAPVASAEYVVDASDMVNATTLISTIANSDISDAERAGLIQMREEEKLARDVYTTLGNLWNTQIFGNIAQSEQTHTDAIKTLLDRYTIADPVSNDTVGIFTSPVMQKLYTDLITQGSVSLLDALKVGATVEDLDIKDLEELIKITDNQDIITVYDNLNKGSRNHLRAYISNISRNGGTYTPQYISQSAYDSIISSEQERGNANSGGNGMGNGMGAGRNR